MAGYVPPAFIADLIAQTDIIDIIGRRVPLKKAGGSFKACCPFHHEKTPSFTVSPKNQTYHCFGCHASGNVISFLMDYEKLEFLEAIEELAQEKGLSVPYEKPRHSGGHFQQNSAPTTSYADRKALYALMENIAKRYQHTLQQTPEARQYLSKRGLSADVVEKFGLGFAPDGFDFLRRNFSQNNTAYAQLATVGMLSESERGNRYDRFRNRLMFPIRDRRGRVIAFGGRVLDDSTPKYLNSPEMVLYHKGSELYGLFEATQQKARRSRLLIVEGYMDVVALAQFGVDYAVASLGTATTPEQLKLAFRTTDQIICCYDADRAGRDAAWRALENVLPFLEDGREIKFIFLPDGEDPDSFVRRYGKAAFEEKLQEALPFSQYLFDHLKPQVDFSTAEGEAKLVQLLKPYLDKIPGKLLRELLLDTLERTLGWWDRNKLNALLKKEQPKPQAMKDPVLQQGFTPIRLVIALLADDPSLARYVSDDDVHLLQQIKQPGVDLFVQMLVLAKERTGLKTAQFLEYWRMDNRYAGVLEKLLAKLHLEEIADYSAVFNENLATLVAQSVKSKIRELIGKSRQYGLNAEEGAFLQMLLRKQHENNK